MFDGYVFIDKIPNNDSDVSIFYLIDLKSFIIIGMASKNTINARSFPICTK